MTKNSSEQIKKLKDLQTKKREQIKVYGEKMRKHIFWLATILAVVSLLFLEYAYKIFGSAANFLLLTLSIFVLSFIIYFIVVRFQTQQRKREIKIIRTKLYRLMKLEND